MQAAEITPWERWNGPICCCMTLFAASAFHSVAAGGDGSAQRVFVPGDLDIDIQTHPREGPNMSSQSILYKSVQRFLEYFIHKQKKQTTRNVGQCPT